MAERTAQPARCCATSSDLRQAHAGYVETRGWAQRASTLRLRWRLRRMPQHTSDQRTAAERKAVHDELRERGALTS